MLQLRRLRQLVLTTETKDYSAPFEPDILVANHAELFSNLDKYIAMIPVMERYNCHYTQGDAPGGKKLGKFLSQDLVTFDIDGIAINASGEFNPDLVTTFFEVTKFDKEKTVVIFSGNGLHFIIQAPTKWEAPEFFKQHKSSYNLLCTRLEEAFKAKEIVIKEVDRQAFSPNRTLRLPGTLNKKPNKEPRHCRIISSCVLKPQSIEILETKIEKQKPQRKTAHQKENSTGNSESAEKKYPPIDSAAVREGCEFLKYSYNNQKDMNEAQWYATLNLVGRLEDGKALAHEYSNKHPNYSPDNTEQKLEQALKACGPRTCSNIAGLWEGCGTCEFNGKVNTPISIRGAEYIRTKDSGFYHITENGKLIPQYEDLRKFFDQEYQYIVNATTSAVYIFNGKKFEYWEKTKLRTFADKHFNPTPRENIVREFCDWITRLNVKDKMFFNREGFINFNNGVLEIATGKLLPHSPEYGCLYVLPYDYDSGAICKEFDAMIHRVTCNDLELENLLLEFVGYGLCDRSYWLQKALLLVGDGANGKSTFLNVVKEIAGRENTSPLSLQDLNVETTRSMLEGKLFNISDEMPSGAVKNTELLKKILGGEVTTRRLFQNAETMDNTAKLIFACNEIPDTVDNTHGLFRRLAIVPFNARFEPEAVDHGLMGKLKIELPGIFNRVFMAYKNLKKRGHLAAARSSSDELETYRSENDSVGTWAKDAIIVTPGSGPWDKDHFMLVSDAFTAYTSDFCAQTNEKAVNLNTFSKVLRRVLPKVRRDRIRIGGRHHRPVGYWGCTVYNKNLHANGHSAAHSSAQNEPIIGANLQVEIPFSTVESDKMA